MAVQIQGGASGAVANVEAGTLAVKVVQRPIDIGSLGAYSLSMVSGTIAAGQGAASPVFAFRWADATRYCLIRRISVSMASLGTGFTAGVGLFNLFFARAFTGMDTGGTSPTLTGNNNKRATSMGTTLVTGANVMIANTAALGAGTRTNDSNPLKNIQFGVNASTNTIQLATSLLDNLDSSHEFPIVLAPGSGEGIEIQATVPATGTWQLMVQVDWEEVTAYP